MLKPEVARQQLAKLKSKKHAEGRHARLRKLPKPLAAAGFGVFGRLADGKVPKDYAEREPVRNAKLAVTAPPVKRVEE